MDIMDSDRTPGTTRPGGRLRRVAGGRQRVVKVRLSAHEEEWLVPKAAVMGISVQRLLVESAMAGGPGSVRLRRTMSEEFLAARRDVHGAAVNLNQLARLGNEHGQAPGGVAAAVARFSEAQERLSGLAEQIVSELNGPVGAEAE